MKLGLYLMVFLVCTGAVFACHSCVSGVVGCYAEGMYIKFYCNGNYRGEKDISSGDGTYEKTINNRCTGTLRGDLYWDNGEEDLFIESVEDDTPQWIGPNTKYEIDFDACDEVPEFTTIGAAIALAGAGLVYKFKRKKQ